MRYCFANWIDSAEGGREPRLPANRGFSLICDLGPGAEWALFDVAFVEDKPVAAGLEEVQEELRLLLDSAKAYPPALAIAREDVKQRWLTRQPSRLEFAADFAEALQQRLRAQPNSLFRLAEVMTEEPGYLEKGEYVWLLRYDPILREVSWVSCDFHIYRSPLSHFDLDDHALGKLTKE